MLILNSVGKVRFHDHRQQKWMTGSLLGVGQERAQLDTKHYMIVEDQSKVIYLAHEGELHLEAEKVNCDDYEMLISIFNDCAVSRGDKAGTKMTFEGFKEAINLLVNGRDES